MYVIIIAGSLPTLRPLVQQGIAKSKNLSESRKRYQSHSHGHNMGHPLQKLASTCDDSTGHGRHQKQDHRGVAAGSDQSILQSRITKTTDVEVSYEDDRPKKQTPEWEQSDVLREPIHAVERV